MKLSCSEYLVDENHSIMIVTRNGSYDCYVMEHDDNGETPYFFMFGLPITQQSFQDAVDEAVASAEDYYYLFEV